MLELTLFPNVLVFFIMNIYAEERDNGFFKRLSWLDHVDTQQLNYGVAVSDVNHDGYLDWIVASQSGPNIILKFDKVNQRLQNIAKEKTKFSALMDPLGQAIGVCACDIDGDGKEEIYFLNTNNAFSKITSSGDKLFRWRDGKYVDIYSDVVNKHIPVRGYAGQSVACIDRLGTGKYSIIVAVFSQDGVGSFAMIEMNEEDSRNDVIGGNIVLRNVARHVGIERHVGGHSLVVGPILSTDGSSDIFFGNEGANFLFKNVGYGIFEDVTFQSGIQDKGESVRGVTLADLNRDGRLDIVYGNWNGKHRIFIQNQFSKFWNIATPEFENSSLVQNIIVADFDNNGNSEIFMNNLFEKNWSQPNKLFTVEMYRDNRDPFIIPLDIGDALESEGRGTGSAVTDMNGDGFLDMLISHGEKHPQSLEVYTSRHSNPNLQNWIRIYPKTRYGAPARGALVKLYSTSGQQTQVIDGGSGYLCQMEPLAHFGLGKDIPSYIDIQWNDGKITRKYIHIDEINSVLVVPHPDTNHTKLNRTMNISKYGNMNSRAICFHEKFSCVTFLTVLICFFAVGE